MDHAAQVATAATAESAASVRPDPDEVFDIHGVAAYLGVSFRTVEDWDKKGVGPARLSLPGRLRRWKRGEVDEWLAARKASGRTATG